MYKEKGNEGRVEVEAEFNSSYDVRTFKRNAESNY